MGLKELLRIGSSALALVLGAIAPFGRANAQPAGTVGAVNPSATGTPPGGASRALALGNAVVRNERLQTSSTGTLQVTFSDRTTLNLGPSTTVVVDNFVYDPATGAGALQANMRSGLLRFVGGQTSHDGNATVRTPVGTIGIRGNMVIVEYDPAFGWRITSLAPGTVTITNNVSQVVIQRAGFVVYVLSANQVILQPTRADPGAIERAFALTLSRPGQTGGALRFPSDSQAARFGIGSVRLPTGGASPLDTLSIFSIQQGAGRNAAQGRQTRGAGPRQPAANRSGAPSANPYGDSR